MNQPPDILLQRASLLYQQGRWEMAADALRQALSMDPQNPVAHALLALCLLHQAQPQSARDEAQQAVHHGPDVPFTHYALACVERDARQYRESLAALEPAIALDPQNADFRALEADNCYQLEHWQQAVDAATAGLAADPENIACGNLRAMALLKLNRKDDAAATLDDALRRNPESPLTLANKGWALLHANDPKAAADFFRDALRIDPNQEYARQGMLAALKARNPLYRILLAYFLWMSRLRRNAQFFLIIGIWLAFQVLSAVEHSHPLLAPFISPLIWAYVVFAITTWLANPLFNLLMLLNRYGRYLLDRSQRNCAALVGVMLAGAAALGIAYFVKGETLLGAGALLCVLMTLPITARYACPRGRARRLMTLYTLAIPLCLAGSVAAAVYGLKQAPLLFDVGLFGAIFSSFVANILMTQVG